MPLLSPSSSNMNYFPPPPTSAPAPTSLPTSNPSPSRPADPTGTELQHLVQKGLISAPFADSHQYILIMNTLALDARYDWILALAVAQHLWTDGGSAPSLSPLEAAIADAARLCLHLNVWPVTSRPCPIALRCVAAIRASLRAYPGLDTLHFAAPDLLLWLALTAGPLALGHARAWFALQLRRAAPLAALPSFAAARAAAAARFAWSPAMGLAAHVFWVAVLHPGAFADDALAEFTRAPGPAGVDAAERAQIWMLAQRLTRESRVARARFGEPPCTVAEAESTAEAEAALVDAVFEAAYWEVDEPGQGRRRPVVWIPPSPPCLLGAKCGAHGGPVAAGLQAPG